MVDGPRDIAAELTAQAGSLPPALEHDYPDEVFEMRMARSLRHTLLRIVGISDEEVRQSTIRITDMLGLPRPGESEPRFPMPEDEEAFASQVIGAHDVPDAWRDHGWNELREMGRARVEGADE